MPSLKHTLLGGSSGGDIVPANKTILCTQKSQTQEYQNSTLPSNYLHRFLPSLTHAGPHIGQLPPATSLPHSLQTLPMPPPLIQSNPNPQPCLPSISQLLSNLTSEGQILPAAVEPAPTPPLSLGHGLPSVSKKVAARIH